MPRSEKDAARESEDVVSKEAGILHVHEWSSTIVDRPHRIHPAAVA